MEYAAKRGLPIMAGSTVTVETAKRTYAQFNGYLQQYGRSTTGLESMLNRCVYVDESQAGATSIPEEPMMWVRDILVKNVAIFGTPDQCVENIRTLEKELGLGYLMCNMAFGGLDHEKVKRSMTLFAQEVMPHFR